MKSDNLKEVPAGTFPAPGMSNREKFQCILEWLYTNDQEFGSKREWRKAFLAYLKELLKVNED